MVELQLIGCSGEMMEGIKILQNKLGLVISESGISVTVEKGCDRLSVKKTSEGYYIGYSEKVELFRGLALLCTALREEKEIDIFEKRQFKILGCMLDVSRGMVFKKEVLLDYLERMALMGFNMFMLYTEDTYELENYPWFGYLKGKYTKAELKEIDNYADTLGIEIIPCIQTLGHLETTLRWPAMDPVRDTSSVLLAGVEETYTFIEEMIKTVRECFRSNRIHIGMDEAIDLGQGKYKQLFGERNHQEIMLEHLERVNKIIEKYHYSPMIWSDMFFRMSGKTGEYDTEAEIPSTLKDTLPKNMEMVYWDYCMENQSVTDKVIRMHKEMERPIVFAGGIWTWMRVGTSFRKSLATAKSQIPVCAKHGVETFIATIWGNDCCIELHSTLPALQVWAELSYHLEADEAFIGERFHACTGYDYDQWKLLYPDDFTDEERALYDAQPKFAINSASQHLHQDILFGFMDKRLSGYDFKKKYDGLRKAIADVDAKDMQPLFDRHKLLYEIIYRKSDIGVRLREAYTSENRTALEKIAEELTELVALYKHYHEVYMDMWYELCKPFGCNRFDRYVSGTCARVANAKKRVDGYLEGKYNRLEELEEEILPYGDMGKPLLEMDYINMFINRM